MRFRETYGYPNAAGRLYPAAHRLPVHTPMKVMIVDDSAAMRLLIRDLVAGVADDVVEHADGAEAVEAYGEDAPDWTIMDVRMPRMDGLEATRRLRARWPDSRIVLISSHGLPGLPAAAAAAGARHYLAKDDLRRLVGLLVPPSETASETTVE